MFGQRKYAIRCDDAVNAEALARMLRHEQGKLFWWAVPARVEGKSLVVTLPSDMGILKPEDIAGLKELGAVEVNPI